MARLTRGVVGMIVAAALAGCTAMTGQSAGRNIDDAGITTAVKAKLGGDRAATLTSVDVDTVSGTVYLTGIVPDAAAKQRAASLARQVDGVVAVENNLQMRPAAAGDAPASDRHRDY
jgi:hyperosmotically inducible protein